MFYASKITASEFVHQFTYEEKCRYNDIISDFKLTLNLIFETSNSVFTLFYPIKGR